MLERIFSKACQGLKTKILVIECFMYFMYILNLSCVLMKSQKFLNFFIYIMFRYCSIMDTSVV